ncbi:lipid-A-disaccharide synthase [Fusobacterium sp. MFO224]|uniref:lipid-A-disaccharide synthase n=1 Tax=Fusobacterium sp. MFO224 TaxID=3378070 RepID=UPI003852FF20
MKIFVSTGEVSGDLHLSYLIKNMLKTNETIEFYGIAGENSEKLGVNILYNIKDLAIMGFVEALKKYNFLKKKAKEYLKFIIDNKIDKVILVDYGGFNLAFLKLIKKYAPHVEVFYYIPPKLWIWGENRIKKLKLADHILVIFPWEVDFYKSRGINVVYYGNPFFEKYSFIEKRGENILLLPGSRKQEIESLLPIMLEIVKEKKENNFILKFPNRKVLEWVYDDLDKYSNLKVEYGNLEDSVKKSKLAIAASGTVTLELSIMGIPTIVLYKVGAINAFIAKKLLKVGLVSLPNIVLNEEVYPELLQEKCEKNEILKYMDLIEKNKEEYYKKIKEVREKLSGKDIVKSYGDYILRGKIND